MEMEKLSTPECTHRKSARVVYRACCFVKIVGVRLIGLGKGMVTSSFRSSTVSASRCSFFAIAFQSVAATPVRQSSFSLVWYAVWMSARAPTDRYIYIERGAMTKLAVYDSAASSQGCG